MEDQVAWLMWSACRQKSDESLNRPNQSARLDPRVDIAQHIETKDYKQFLGAIADRGVHYSSIRNNREADSISSLAFCNIGVANGYQDLLCRRAYMVARMRSCVG